MKIEKGNTPINKMAVKVVFGEKIHFNPATIHKNVYKTQPICATEKDLDPKAWKAVKDFTGKKFGRLTVVGTAKYMGVDYTAKTSQSLKKFESKYPALMRMPEFNEGKQNAHNKKPYSRRSTMSNGRLYVCRCACGLFTVNRRKTLNAGAKTQCDSCDYTEYLRNGCKYKEQKNAV